MIVEACINADDLLQLAADIQTALDGGARRIELCGVMSEDGLTPSVRAISLARQVMADCPGLLVMIRPRAGDFCYHDTELQQMMVSIRQAAAAGADGVVFGLLTPDAQLDLTALQQLMPLCHQLGVAVTFHRAFDALARPEQALEPLIALGVQRILTAGTAWGSGQGIHLGIPQIRRWLELTAGRIELVLGGGIQPETMPLLLSELAPWRHQFSVHSYSALLQQGRVDKQRVAALVAQCQG